MYRPTSRTAFTTAVLATSLLVMPLVATTASAATAPAMPTGLKVVRAVATPTDLAVTWVSSFGKAILLRQWSQGRGCGTPLAIAHFPAGIVENAAHQVTVVVKGDTLYLSVDGNVVFDVPSLAAAMRASYCGMAAPTGTDIRFRTWGAGTSATFTGTTLS
jgi:hypothetical protein